MAGAGRRNTVGDSNLLPFDNSDRWGVGDHGGAGGEDYGGFGDGSQQDPIKQEHDRQTRVAVDAAKSLLQRREDCNRYVSGAEPAGGEQASTVLDGVEAAGRIRDEGTAAPGSSPDRVVYAEASGPGEGRDWGPARRARSACGATSTPPRTGRRSTTTRS